MFEAVSHIQDRVTLDITFQYAHHVNKVGKIVTFYQLQGVSYNFVAVQDSNKKDEDTTFDKNGDKKRYCHFKHLLTLKEKEKVDQFEAQLKNEAYYKIKVPRVS